MRAADSDAGRHRGFPNRENLNHPLADGAGEIRLLRGWLDAGRFTGQYPVCFLHE
ncbi:MAG TPA: hypothetical protein VGK40_03810 [Verrucomicrobiae bacterium]|jgi:hypothetical protein